MEKYIDQQRKLCHNCIDLNKVIERVWHDYNGYIYRTDKFHKSNIKFYNKLYSIQQPN